MTSINERKINIVRSIGIAGLTYVDFVVVPIVIETTARVNDNLLKLNFFRRELALKYPLAQSEEEKDSILESFDIVSNDILKIIGF